MRYWVVSIILECAGVLLNSSLNSGSSYIDLYFLSLARRSSSVLPSPSSITYTGGSCLWSPTRITDLPYARGITSSENGTLLTSSTMTTSMSLLERSRSMPRLSFFFWLLAVQVIPYTLM